MRSGNSFGIWYNFAKLYRESQKLKVEYFGTFSAYTKIPKLGLFRLVFLITENVPKYLWPKYTQKWWKMVHKSLKKWPKNKKLIILAPERARTVLNLFLECMYSDVGYVSFRQRPSIFENSSIFLTFLTYVENSGIFLDRGFQLQLFSEGIFGKHFW